MVGETAGAPPIIVIDHETLTTRLSPSRCCCQPQTISRKAFRSLAGLATMAPFLPPTARSLQVKKFDVRILVCVHASEELTVRFWRS